MPKPSNTKSTKSKQQSAGVVKFARALVRAAGPGSMQVDSGRGHVSVGRAGSELYTKTVQQVRTLELKSVDTPSITGALNTTGSFQVLNVPVNGAAFYNRIGNQIEMRSLHLIGGVQATGNAGTVAGEYVRIMVIYDRQPNGAAPSVADVLTSYAQAGGTTSTVFDHLNPNNKQRFLVLMDDRLSFGNTLKATAANAQTQGAIDYKGETNINRFIKLRGLTTTYKASAGAIGDITVGALQIFCLGSTVAGTEGYSFTGSARLRFTD